VNNDGCWLKIENIYRDKMATTEDGTESECAAALAASGILVMIVVMFEIQKEHTRKVFGITHNFGITSAFVLQLMCALSLKKGSLTSDILCILCIPTWYICLQQHSAINAVIDGEIR
jgi:DMSO/TMAO reductase YedYZ heme-binding membrane subunit